jgi:hypothetical protein
MPLAPTKDVQLTISQPGGTQYKGQHHCVNTSGLQTSNHDEDSLVNSKNMSKMPNFHRFYDTILVLMSESLRSCKITLLPLA